MNGEETAKIEPQLLSYVVLVAAPLGDVDSTLHRLFGIEVLVTALVLAAIVALGLWVVRISLRPLTAIGATAAAIAGGDLSRTRESGGLGLGLWIVAAVAEAHGGSVRVRETYCGGATFVIELPLAAGPDAGD